MTELSDSQKINMIMDALGENPNSLSISLGYKSPQTIYFVKNGENSLSTGMKYRILDKYPQVNSNFMNDGSLPVVLTGADLQAQINLLGKKTTAGKNTLIDLAELADIPKRLSRIENMLVKLLQENENNS